jgi:ABC-type multidrug transport system fused ATPase/permease subunit
VFSALTAAVGAADQVVELMNRTPDLPPAGSLAPAALEGRIDFRGVVFAYPARPRHTVLNELSFGVRPGGFWVVWRVGGWHTLTTYTLTMARSH